MSFQLHSIEAISLGTAVSWRHHDSVVFAPLWNACKAGNGLLGRMRWVFLFIAQRLPARRDDKVKELHPGTAAFIP